MSGLSSVPAAFTVWRASAKDWAAPLTESSTPRVRPGSIHRASEEAATLLAEFQKRFQASQGKAPSYVGTQGFVGTYMLLDKVLRTAGGRIPPS